MHDVFQTIDPAGTAPAAPLPERTRPLKIALVTSSYNFIKDGIALTLNRLVDYLERQGAEVLVFAPVGSTRAIDHVGTIVPVPSIALPPRPEYRLTFGLWPKLQRRLRAFRPDIMHIAVPDALGLSALRFARRHGIPVVASYHTRYDTYFKHYWYLGWLTGPCRRYLRWFYGACREVYVPSASMAEALLRDGFRDNLRLWPRGVDVARFHPAKRSGEWRSRHGIGESDLAIIHVARLVREKQLDTLTGILHRLEAGGIAHKAVIVGDGPERKALEKQLPRAVFTGFLDGEDLATAYASSDIFLFPSDTETFGNVTLEAMASGLPTVCADATGSRSLVVPGRTGFLAAPGKMEEFAAHMARLAGDSALRREIGAAARERSKSYSWDDATGRVLHFYTELLAAAAPDAAS